MTAKSTFATALVITGFVSGLVVGVNTWLDRRQKNKEEEKKKSEHKEEEDKGKEEVAMAPTFKKKNQARKNPCDWRIFKNTKTLATKRKENDLKTRKINKIHKKSIYLKKENGNLVLGKTLELTSSAEMIRKDTNFQVLEDFIGTFEIHEMVLLEVDDDDMELFFKRYNEKEQGALRCKGIVLFSCDITRLPFQIETLQIVSSLTTGFSHIISQNSKTLTRLQIFSEDSHFPIKENFPKISSITVLGANGSLLSSCLLENRKELDFLSLNTSSFAYSTSLVTPIQIKTIFLNGEGSFRFFFQGMLPNLQAPQIILIDETSKTFNETNIECLNNMRECTSLTLRGSFSFFYFSKMIPLMNRIQILMLTDECFKEKDLFFMKNQKNNISFNNLENLFLVGAQCVALFEIFLTYSLPKLRTISVHDFSQKFKEKEISMSLPPNTKSCFLNFAGAVGVFSHICSTVYDNLETLTLRDPAPNWDLLLENKKLYTSLKMVKIQSPEIPLTLFQNQLPRDCRLQLINIKPQE